MTPIQTNARIQQMTPLTDTILKLILCPEKYIEYEAGQYLQILFNHEAFSYSIANAPVGSKTYELHIRHGREKNTAQNPLIDEIKKQGTVEVRLPLGDCHLKKIHPNKPILFIAGGTGFSPIKAMIEQLIAEGDPRAFELFWVTRSQTDFYMQDKISQWQKEVLPFKYFSQSSDSAKVNLISDILSRHSHDLSEWQMVISGPFDLAYHVRDRLLSKGALCQNIFSDAFHFEKPN